MNELHRVYAWMCGRVYARECLVRIVVCEVHDFSKQVINAEECSHRGWHVVICATCGYQVVIFCEQSALKLVEVRRTRDSCGKMSGWFSRWVGDVRGMD